jgi:hypothetical protein
MAIRNGTLQGNGYWDDGAKNNSEDFVRSR